ncbi:DEAD/DEAH box helicase [Alkalispirochaeta sphaeroplastigenens]|uniref:DEAD/DEAH box helicase n=1 Tax=Alkalispirochaeta sphaeroplastigenens TaxID=1187066 RepID=A0A2S4JNT1_9SPIO|nr:DEAD/DEAH box helicase [Alkalispirochaeta sphaeroplastigenens]POR01133.1 DEAD/DEAH box helicase [Alkalispirochaeta sphaeroplastigenens]
MNQISFSDLCLQSGLEKALQANNFETPTPIQAQAIPPVLKGHDILASAQTGSGKTAAFALPLLSRLAEEESRPRRGAPRALILAPTRELAGQIASVLATFGRPLRLSTVVIYGGVSKSGQINALRRGVDIAVATPGRLLDLMSDGFITLKEIQMIVLDEADRMLDMGFIPDVKRIIKELPEKRQALFFSATVPGPVAQLADQLLRDPVRISVESDRSSDPDIDQKVLFVSREEKKDALKMILTEGGCFRALVFTRTKHRARDLAKHLSKSGIPSDDIHGDKSQNARSRALANFDRGRVQVLVATDVASRGIDVKDIDHVINYELPNESESYVHRIGRTARAGKSGIALSLCDETELNCLSLIQRALKQVIPVFADHPFHSTSIATAATRRDRPSRGPGQGGGNRGGRNFRKPQSSRSRPGRPQGPRPLRQAS